MTIADGGIYMIIAEKFLDMNFTDGKYKDMMFEEPNSQEGLPKDERVLLYYLNKHSGCKMGDLASVFGMANSTTNFVIKKLISKNYVDVTPLPSDNRVRIVSITKDGRKKVEFMVSFIQESLTKFYTLVHNEIYKKTIDDFSAQEVKTLDKFYKKAMIELEITDTK